MVSIIALCFLSNLTDPFLRLVTIRYDYQVVRNNHQSSPRIITKNLKLDNYFVMMMKDKSLFIKKACLSFSKTTFSNVLCWIDFTDWG